MFERVFLVAALLVGLAGCGNFPAPFQGNPGATARRLAEPTAPLLIVLPPRASLMPDGSEERFASILAGVLQDREIPAQAGRQSNVAWRLQTKLDPGPNGLVPVFTVLDPSGVDKGSTEGAPASVALWSLADDAFMKRVATDATPGISSLLTAIRTAYDRADPNSLLNRPPKIVVTDVVGAPGDGNRVLTKLVRDNLAEYGMVVQSGMAGADFVVRGSVMLEPVPNKKQRIEIVWVVALPSGDERGKVAQLNEIPAGLLDRYWGDVALVVANEASGGIADVIARQSGRDPGEPIPGTAPQPAAVAEPLPLPPPPPPLAPPRGRR